MLGCDAFSPCSLEPHHPDLFWYGVHGVEILFTIMGPGCQTVSRTHTDDTELVVGVWKDGRIGTFRGIAQGTAQLWRHGVRIAESIQRSGDFGGYEPLVVEIAKFFRSRQAAGQRRRNDRDHSPSWKRPTKASSRAASRSALPS